VVARTDHHLAVAVSLDVSNALNTIGWEVVLVAVSRIGLPPYLRRILLSYFGE